MPISEFQIIERFFARSAVRREDVILGIGDDAAQVRVPPGHEVIIDTGALTEGTDFAAADDPGDLGHRILAGSLARLTAAGSEPAWFTLALTVPEPDEQWLSAFSAALIGLAERCNVALIGGDTTRGPRNAVLHAHGLVTEGRAVADRQPAPGDLLYVLGPLGDGGLAILASTREIRLPGLVRARVREQVLRPEPPIALAAALRATATAATTLADGLARSVQRLLGAAGLGGMIQVERLPLSPALDAFFHQAGGWPVALHAPEPCRLCFSIPAAQQAELEDLTESAGLLCTWVGTVEPRPGLRCVLDDGSALETLD